MTKIHIPTDHYPDKLDKTRPFLTRESMMAFGMEVDENAMDGENPLMDFGDALSELEGQTRMEL